VSPAENESSMPSANSIKEAAVPERTSGDVGQEGDGYIDNRPLVFVEQYQSGLS
jgi:hypothetical protein